jgi:hypothetical protein
VGPNNSMGVVELYHIVLATTKITKKKNISDTTGKHGFNIFY